MYLDLRCVCVCDVIFKGKFVRALRTMRFNDHDDGDVLEDDDVGICTIYDNEGDDFL